MFVCVATHLEVRVRAYADPAWASESLIFFVSELGNTEHTIISGAASPPHHTLSLMLSSHCRSELDLIPCIILILAAAICFIIKEHRVS